jgi:hypothetical protein
MGFYVSIDRISCIGVYVNPSQPTAGIIERLPEVIGIGYQPSIDNYAPFGCPSPCPEIVLQILVSRPGILGLEAAYPVLAKISAHALKAACALRIAARRQKAYY